MKPVSCKILVYHYHQKVLMSDVLPALLPAGKSFREYFDLFTGLDDRDLLFFFSHCDDACIDKLYLHNSATGFYHILAVICKDNYSIPDTREEFLESITDPAIKETIGKFLFDHKNAANILSIHTGTIEFENFEIKSEYTVSLRGVTGFGLKDRKCLLVFNDRHIFLTHLLDMDESKLHRLMFYQDMTIVDYETVFCDILSVYAQDKKIFVLHAMDQADRSVVVLSTFEHENKMIYRDTGNRILSRTGWDLDFIDLEVLFHCCEGPVSDTGLWNAQNFLDEKLRSGPQLFIDAFLCGRNEFFILSREKKEDRFYIYHSASDKKDKYLVAAFSLPEKPRSFVYLKDLDVFFVTAGTEVYMIDPVDTTARPQKIGAFFSVNGQGLELYGVINQLVVLNTNHSPVLVLVQEDRLLYSILKNV